ncbi:hypothetical protein [Guptibacillus algicola]|uniref:hypothetical protein n=1 Tax=Guptibacillus algicola TaxID=225844 RepID=UPI001CD4BF6E|nr:hypothetical protein [Alkalihalobacillus algicola]MCA0987070.1 hypothetical protein [Alkalihalobacillus algicola]
MMKKLLRKPMVIAGALFILLLLVGSFLYSALVEPPQPEKMLYDGNGDVVALAPFPPSATFPLGSDIDGNNFMLKLLEGAKFTIGLSIIVALGRMVLSFIGGYLLFLLPASFRKFLAGLADTFHYAPVTIFTYVLIAPVVMTFSWSYSTPTKIIFPMLVLMLISVPVLSLYVQKELDLIAQKEFIDSAKVMGGSHFHIFKAHMAPFLNPKLLIIFIQQVGQVLIVFAHLGLLRVFIGGTDVRVLEYDITTGEATTAAFTMSNEWAGLIAQNFQYVNSFPWMILAPVTAFALTILAINGIVYGLKSGPTYKRKRKKTKAPNVSYTVNAESFELRN